LTQEWDKALKTFEVTQFGAWHVCQKAAAQMAKQSGGKVNGKLIIISSVMADTPHLLPTSTAYNMSKGALDTMTRTLASGLAQHRITVNCIHPGWILTDGETNFVEKEKIHTLANKALPFGVGSPEDVAKGCCYLASADADYVTGAILNIDGGWMVAPRIAHLQDPIGKPSDLEEKKQPKGGDDGEGGGAQ
jgi:glucose 1-dehydrogenase